MVGIYFPRLARLGVHAVVYLSHGQTSLVIKVTPFTVRHLKVLPWRMPYWLTLRLVRLASPRLVAGMVTTSPTDMSPIG